MVGERPFVDALEDALEIILEEELTEIIVEEELFSELLELAAVKKIGVHNES
jgi:hypothetical protein